MAIYKSIHERKKCIRAKSSWQHFMERKYLSIKEAARMVGVTPLTLRNWDKKGILTSYRNPVNNYRVYRADQMELFLRKIENSKNKRSGRRIDISIAWFAWFLNLTAYPLLPFRDDRHEMGVRDILVPNTNK